MTNDPMEIAKTLALEVAKKLALSSAATVPLTPNDHNTVTLSPNTQNLETLDAIVKGAIGEGKDKWSLETRPERNRQLSNLYSLIRGYEVRVGVVSRSDDFVSFNIAKNGTNQRHFSIYMSNNEIRLYEDDRPVDRITQKDEKYEQWKQAFEEASKLEPNKMYTGKEFFRLIPALREALNPRIDDKNEQKGQDRWADAFLPNGEFIKKYFPGLSNIFTTTPSTETTSNKSGNTVHTTTKLFDFGAAKELESSTKGIDYTTENIRKYNKENEIPDGAIRRGKDGTGIWNSGLVNVTMEENRPVFNKTDVKEPTAVPGTEESDEGMSKKQVASISIGSALAGTLLNWLVGKCRQAYNRLRGSGGHDIETGVSEESEETRSFLSELGYTLRTSSSAGSLATDPLLSQGGERQAEASELQLSAAQEVSDDDVEEIKEMQERIQTVLSASISYGEALIVRAQAIQGCNHQAMQEIIDNIGKSVKSLRTHIKVNPNSTIPTSSALTKEEPHSTISPSSDLPSKEELAKEERVISKIWSEVRGDEKRINDLIQAMEQQAQAGSVDSIASGEEPRATDSSDNNPLHQAEQPLLSKGDGSAGKSDKHLTIPEEEETESLLNDAGSDIQGVEQTAPKVVGALPHANTSELRQKFIGQIHSNIACFSALPNSVNSESLAMCESRDLISFGESKENLPRQSEQGEEARATDSSPLKGHAQSSESLLCTSSNTENVDEGRPRSRSEGSGSSRPNPLTGSNDKPSNSVSNSEEFAIKAVTPFLNRNQRVILNDDGRHGSQEMLIESQPKTVKKSASTELLEEQKASCKQSKQGATGSANRPNSLISLPLSTDLLLIGRNINL